MDEKVCMNCEKEKPCREIRESVSGEFVGFMCEDCLDEEEQQFIGLEPNQVREHSRKGPHGYGLYAVPDK